MQIENIISGLIWVGVFMNEWNRNEGWSFDQKLLKISRNSSFLFFSYAYIFNDFKKKVSHYTGNESFKILMGELERTLVTFDWWYNNEK